MSRTENGKPKKDGRELRTRVICVRFTEEKRSRITEEMKKSGLTFSAFARKRIFGKRVATNEAMDVLERLRQHGRVIRQACEESGGGYSDATAQAIKDLSAYVRDLNGKRFGVAQDNNTNPR